jgi:hypothetical protein
MSEVHKPPPPPPYFNNKDKVKYNTYLYVLHARVGFR